MIVFTIISTGSWTNLGLGQIWRRNITFIFYLIALSKEENYHPSNWLDLQLLIMQLIQFMEEDNLDVQNGKLKLRAYEFVVFEI